MCGCECMPVCVHYSLSCYLCNSWKWNDPYLDKHSKIIVLTFVSRRKLFYDTHSKHKYRLQWRKWPYMRPKQYIYEYMKWTHSYYTSTANNKYDKWCEVGIWRDAEVCVSIPAWPHTHSMLRLRLAGRRALCVFVATSILCSSSIFIAIVYLFRIDGNKFWMHFREHFFLLIFLHFVIVPRSTVVHASRIVFSYGKSWPVLWRHCSMAMCWCLYCCILLECMTFMWRATGLWITIRCLSAKTSELIPANEHNCHDHSLCPRNIARVSWHSIRSLKTNIKMERKTEIWSHTHHAQQRWQVRKKETEQKKKNISIIMKLLTFFPSNSWVPCANTLSTLDGSPNVMNPKPL